MLARIVLARPPRVLPGLSEADSAIVWDRANGYVLAADDGELSDQDRAQLQAALEAQPRLRALASLYLQLIVFAVFHPTLCVAAAVLLPATILHLLYLGLRKIIGS